MQINKKTKSMPLRVFLVALFLVIFLGFSLRFYNLAKESLWIDEGGGVILVAKKPIGHILNPEVDLSISTYHVILHYWMQLFGEKEFAVRFPALIFGVLSIFMIYKVGKIIFNQEIGLLSALILSISPFHVHYSQEAKPYSLLMLLSLASIYYFIKFIKSSDEKNFNLKFDSQFHRILNSLKNKKDIGIYIVLMLVGIYTHYFFFFLLIFQNIYFFIYYIKYKKIVKSWLISQCIIVFIFLLYNPFFLKHIKWGMKDGLTYLNPYFSLFSIIKTFYVFILDFSFINPDYCVPCFYVNPFIIFLICAVFLLLIFLGIRRLFVYKQNFKEVIFKNKKLVFLILYLTIPVITLYIISFIIPLFQVRYVIYSSAPLYILVSRGISGFKKSIKIAFVVLLLFLFSFVLHGYYTDVTKEQWREATNFINEYSEEEDTIIYPYSTFIFSYYNAKIDKNRVIPNQYPYPKDDPEVFGKPLRPRDIDEITSKYNRVWLVLPSTWELADYKEITNEFKTLILEKEFKGVKIYLYDLSIEKK